MRRTSSYFLFYLLLTSCFIKASSLTTYLSLESRPTFNRLVLYIKSPAAGRPEKHELDATRVSAKVIPGVNLLRYDFIENTDIVNNKLYATLLVAKPIPVRTQTKLITSTSAFLFLRSGQAVILDVTNKTASVPGLGFPVGGITLIAPNKGKSSQEPEIIIGNVEQVTDVTRICGSYRNSPPATSNINYNDQCISGYSGWDVVFAWQPPRLPAVSTFTNKHKYSHSQLTESGFFATIQPKAEISCSNFNNALNKLPAYIGNYNAWVLGWLVDGTTDRLVKLGLSQQITTVNNVNNKIKVGGYLMGAMHPRAEVAWYRDSTINDMLAVDNGFKQTTLTTINNEPVDLAIVTGTEIPLIARDANSKIDGQFSQLIVVGRTFWLKINDCNRNLLIQSDQQFNEDVNSMQLKTIATKTYGTTVTFMAYLNTKQLTK